MWSLLKIVFVTVGLYLVIVNMYDMINSPTPANIGMQSVSLAIGGGLLSYGFNVTPVTSTINSVVGGLKDAIIEALKASSRVVKDVAKDAGKSS